MMKILPQKMLGAQGLPPLCHWFIPASSFRLPHFVVPSPPLCHFVYPTLSFHLPHFVISSEARNPLSADRRQTAGSSSHSLLGMTTLRIQSQRQTNMAAHRQPGRRQNLAETSLGGWIKDPALHNSLLPRQQHHRLNARHHRRARIRGCAIHANHLPRLRRHQSHPPRHHVNPLRIAQ